MGIPRGTRWNFSCLPETLRTKLMLVSPKLATPIGECGIERAKSYESNRVRIDVKAAVKAATVILLIIELQTISLMPCHSGAI